jgi:hypothetical protein
MSNSIHNNPWNKVTKRMESTARGLVRSGSGNFAVLHISIYINAQGSPIGWSSPRGDRLEPRGPWLLNTDLVNPIDQEGD